jgi:IS30 family transposase
MATKKNKGGRPKIDIPELKVEQLASFGCTNVEIAQFFGVNESTIRRGFAENLTKGRASGKIKLRQLQMKAAEAGNVSMLIWLGKQVLGQQDKQEIELIKPIEEVDFHGL